ncbi:unnamed protein product [Spirodela intermedia]|uniref:Uncharacterized protein n=1 Tax=Spirodela intermedia TaxID=51605 RepID=A0A7I8JNV5_SPIIN|nr:unnamed protein product [Spirodela intermedia]CAA6671780.1 unnamed protein product [Spirodela intermedia]
MALAWVLTSVGVLVATVVVIWRWTRRGLNLPPGPRRWPVVGNLLQLSSLPHKDLAAYSAAYGPLAGRRFASRPRTLAAVHLAYGCGDVALAPLGPKWKRMRRICMEHLLTTRRLDAFAGHRAAEARHLVAEVRRRAAAGEAVNLREVLAAFSMNNSGAEEEALEFMEITHEMFRLLGMIYLGDYLPAWRWVDPFGCERKMREVERRIDDFHSRIIDQHKKKAREMSLQGAAPSCGEMDFVDVLLSLPGEDGKDHLDDVEIKALIQRSSATPGPPEGAGGARCRRGEGQASGGTDLAGLSYLRCVVRETFRMHPAGPFLIPHESTRPTKLLNYDVPAGTRVFINTYALGRNPRLWEDVDEFLPERHLPTAADGGRVEISHGPDFKILPFSAGKRKCPGAPLGWSSSSWRWPPSSSASTGSPPRASPGGHRHDGGLRDDDAQG